MLLTAIAFILLLTVLVIIHEAGHYFVAKFFGIKVEEFGFGLPPRALGKKIGETIYSLNWLPVGGFVKLYGEDEAGGGRIELKVKSEKLKVEDENRAFYSRSAWQRALVVVAGVVMNTLLAALIFYIFMLIGNFKTELPIFPGLPVPHFFLVNEQVATQLIIGTVAKNSPASKAGITPISQVITVNGMKINNVEYFLTFVKENKGKPITLEWKDLQTNKTTKAVLIPRVNPPKNQGALGISYFPSQTVFLNYQTPVQKILSGFTHPANLMVYNFIALQYLVHISIQQHTVQPLSQGVSGPVGIFNIVGAVVHIQDGKERILEILNLAGILSISLAFFNVLPIPGLDGGRLFFILIEGIFGKKVNPKVEGYIHTVGMALLLTLIVLITYKDIMQLFVK